MVEREEGPLSSHLLPGTEPKLHTEVSPSLPDLGLLRLTQDGDSASSPKPWLSFCSHVSGTFALHSCNMFPSGSSYLSHRASVDPSWA